MSFTYTVTETTFAIVSRWASSTWRTFSITCRVWSSTLSPTICMVRRFMPIWPDTNTRSP